ncbi:MAG: hypothetical protein ACTHM6_01350 [Tepidisphaeraceae bacterium]
MNSVGGANADTLGRMLQFYKFRQELFGPVPAREVYQKRGAGKGWPEECPPLRAANAFGYDILANFDVTFLKKRDGTWSVEQDRVIESDFDWSPDEETDGHPLTQKYAWFWEKGQTIPHSITDNVFAQIRNQVKVSSFLFLKTDPNELLLMTEVPNQWRPFRVWSAIVDTDWYPASYPWHAVLELDPAQKKITIAKGEPICRVIPVRRDTYFAQQMSPEGFDELFQRSQRWLSVHGKRTDEESTIDITRTYVKQQIKSKFVTLD